jgi:endo-1,3-1,4-beta-glycanase ExoK
MHTAKRMGMIVVTIWAILALSSLASAKIYKGAELYSFEAVKYGRWEYRMMAAKGSGTLSTFFLYKNGSEKGDVPWEEVDMEIKGKDNADYFQSNIITGTASNRIMDEEMHGPYGLGDGFNTFALEWTPDSVVWELNGNVIRVMKTSQVQDLQNPQSYRFNLWAAGDAGWVGAFDPNILPVYQVVNWIQYSEYTPGSGDNGSNFTFAWRDDFNDLDTGRWGLADWTFAENITDFDPANVIVRDGMLILALTREGQTGFTGQVPADDEETSTGANLRPMLGAEHKQGAFMRVENNQVVIHSGQQGGVKYYLNGGVK